MIFIDDFEEDIDYLILQRGNAYFLEGAIADINISGGEVNAIVSGTYEYEVSMSIDNNGNILSSYCDCPYDMGEFCKHEVAVMYAIREYFKHNEKSNPGCDLKELLLKQSKEDLVQSLYDAANENRKLKEKLIIKFSKYSDSLEDCRLMIWRYINAAKERGRLTTENLDEALEGAYRVIESADKIAETDYFEAAKRYIEVIDIITALDVCYVEYDDWYNIESYICHTGFYNENECMCPDEINNIVFFVIEKLGELSAYDKDNRLFKLLLKKMNGDVYNCYYDACVCFCERKENREIIEKMISKLASSEEVLRYQYELIKRYDGKVCEYEFLENHINVPEFRDEAIINAMADGNYDRVIFLVENIPDELRQRRGYYEKWQKTALQAHEHLKNTDKVKEYMIRFIKKGEFEYNEKLKTICSEDEWNNTLRVILDYLRKNNSYHYETILVKEQQYKELFSVCKKNKGKILKYYPYFTETDRDEAITIFFEECIKEASQLCARNAYNRLCLTIGEFGKCYGLEEALKITECLKNNHRRKPAFVDELCSVERKLKNIF